VLDGTLTTWDTSELNGLFAVQLQAVRNDQRVDTAAIQVTVDNTPPEVTLTYPQPGQELDTAPNKQVIFQAQAEDNLALAGVEFIVDGTTIGSQEQGPFAQAWTTSRGDHTVRIIARDRAGNQNEDTLDFSIK